MSGLASRAIAVGLLVIVVGAGSAASAADREFCHDYSNAALRQVRAALSNRRCTFRMENETRWSSDGRTHFEWCKGVSRQDANAERDARRRMLDHCRGDERRW